MFENSSRHILGHSLATKRSTALLVGSLLIAATILPGPWVPTAEADSKIASITKSAVYGAGLGLLLGGVTALVVDEDSRDDSIRWGIVLGTFAGFGYGVYNVAAGSEDDFFIAQQSTTLSETTFTATTHFVGTHGRWVAEDTSSLEASASRPSGLFVANQSIGPLAPSRLR